MRVNRATGPHPGHLTIRSFGRPSLARNRSALSYSPARIASATARRSSASVAHSLPTSWTEGFEGSEGLGDPMFRYVRYRRYLFSRLTR